MDTILICNNYSKAQELSDYFEKYGESDRNIRIIICNEGRCEVLLDGRSYTITAQDFIIAAPYSSLKIPGYGSSTKIDMFIINPDILPFKDSHDEINELYRMYNECPHNSLPDKKYLMYKIIYHYLLDFQKDNTTKYKLRIIQHYISILFYEACSIICNPHDKVPSTTRNPITKKFFVEVENSFRKEKKLEFYADRIGITAKYLSQVIAQETGYTATKWIEGYTLKEAKKLLQEGRLSAQEISYELSFSTPSHFGLFFKKKTGMTPKEYSRKCRESV